MNSTLSAAIHQTDGSHCSNSFTNNCGRLNWPISEYAWACLLRASCASLKMITSASVSSRYLMWDIQSTVGESIISTTFGLSEAMSSSMMFGPRLGTRTSLKVFGLRVNSFSSRAGAFSIVLSYVKYQFA